jgi:hypothetical protein
MPSDDLAGSLLERDNGPVARQSAAMELWQLDVTASLFLADGRECKIITGIDDHSRFCIISTVVVRATARAVCSAFHLRAARSWA